MLARYPGPIVGGITIAPGGVAFEYMMQVTRPALGLPESNRIVALRLWQTAPVPNVEEQALHDFLVWRAELKSIEDIAAFCAVERNLLDPNGVALSVKTAEITPSGFRVARSAPMLGRPLQENDALPGAPAVIELSASIWRDDLGADPSILGRVLLLGSELRRVRVRD